MSCPQLGVGGDRTIVASIGMKGRRSASVVSASPGSLEVARDDGAQLLDDFCKLFATSLSEETFVKATLSQNKGADKTLKNVYLRLVSLKAGVYLQAKLRHKVRTLPRPAGLSDDALVRAPLTRACVCLGRPTT